MPRITSLPDSNYVGYESHASGGARTSQTSGKAWTLQAYDVDGASWTTFIAATAGDTPTCVISGATMNAVASASGQPLTVKAGDATGTNVAGSATMIEGGAATGSAFGGSIVFRTSAIGGSGDAVQTQVTHWRINEVGNFFPETTGAVDIGNETKRVRNIYVSNTIFATGSQIAGAFEADNAGAFYWHSGGTIRSIFRSPAQNVIAMQGGADEATGFKLLVWGAASSANPALRKNGTMLEVVLGNESAYAGLKAATLQLDLSALPTSDPGVAGAVWRSANDLKISTGP